MAKEKSYGRITFKFVETRAEISPDKVIFPDQAEEIYEKIGKRLQKELEQDLLDAMTGFNPRDVTDSFPPKKIKRGVIGTSEA